MGSWFYSLPGYFVVSYLGCSAICMSLMSGICLGICMIDGWMNGDFQDGMLILEYILERYEISLLIQ